MAETEAEREMSRTEVADYLRRFADELDTTTTTRTEHQSETPDTPEDEHQQRSETRSASEGKPSDESGVLDSLADDDHENEEDKEDEDHRNHSDRDRAGESGQSPPKVTFMVGNDSTTINPPETVAFEMAVDSESALIGTETGRTARFALHWDDESVSEDDEFSIQ